MDLKDIVCEVKRVSPAALSQLQSIVTERHVVAKEEIISQHRRSREVFFIRNGVFRNFALMDGYEDTRWFALDGDIFAAMHTFVADEPAIASVEALTDGDLYVAKVEDVKRLAAESHEWASWLNEYLLGGFLVYEKRYTYLGRGDAMARYRTLMKVRSFEMLEKVPLQYIASYLNMTPQTLSKIRRRIALGR